MGYSERVNISKNALGHDAWGRAKTSTDKSLFHGLFTFNVPVQTWFETLNGTVLAAFSNATSVDGALNIVAGGTASDKTVLRSFRNPRYQPNRGHLYSTAAIIDNPTALMQRDFGIGTGEAAVCFRVITGGMEGVIVTTVGGVTSEDTVTLDLTGIDLSKGNVFDVQFQWRGVGNYVFFINLKEVGRFEYLGTLTELSMFNPALPIFFSSQNLGDNDSMRFGCVDVTSEGGEDAVGQYGSISIPSQTGEVTIPAIYDCPIIVLRSKLTVATLINTRDTLIKQQTATSDEKAFIRIWKTRDFTAITENNQAWADYGDGHLEYLIYDTPNVATAMTFDDTKANLLFASRVAKDDNFVSSPKSDAYLTPGDMFIFTMHRENGGATDMGLTVEFTEEI